MGPEASWHSAERASHLAVLRAASVHAVWRACAAATMAPNTAARVIMQSGCAGVYARRCGCRLVALTQALAAPTARPSSPTFVHAAGTGPQRARQRVRPRGGGTMARLQSRRRRRPRQSASTSTTPGAWLYLARHHVAATCPARAPNFAVPHAGGLARAADSPPAGPDAVVSGPQLDCDLAWGRTHRGGVRGGGGAGRRPL